MTKLYSHPISKLLFLVALLLAVQIVMWPLVQANEPTKAASSPSPSLFTFEPAKPKVDTKKELKLKVSGTQGELVWKAAKGEIRGSGMEVTYLGPSNPGTDTVTVTDATKKTANLTVTVEGFPELQLTNVLFLFLVGFVGGLVSGFIGSGGAFVLTPAMMSMGIPAVMAVASNMCHKFPKALVGAMKRAKYGQVDVKLGIVMGISAEAGVLIGAQVQKHIQHVLGEDGSNLYVSTVFVVVLALVGGYVLYDAYKIYRTGHTETETVTKLARWIQSINIPGTMMYFPSLKAKVSVLFTVPLGFATGMLAATIAIGGFIGVPSMMYILGAPGLMASATELVIAFVMGMGGTIKYALDGYVDIRLAMIILGGSLFGIQLGAIGTTYVKDYLIKVVMGVIMILVLFSRGLKVPVYLSNLEYIERINENVVSILDQASFIILILALATGATIILYALIKGYLAHAREQALPTTPSVAIPVTPEMTPLVTTGRQLSPMGRFERVLLLTDSSEFSAGAIREAIRLVQRTDGCLTALSVVMSNPEYESLAAKLLEKEKNEALLHLDQVKATAVAAGVECEIILRHGVEIYQEIVEEAENNQSDVIVMGRRGKHDLMRLMMGSTTAKVIGYSHCPVLIVPRAALLEGNNILLAVDGSRYSDAAATAAANLAKQLRVPIIVISVVHPSHTEVRRAEAEQAVKRVISLLQHGGTTVSGQVVTGRPAETIVETAQQQHSGLIVVGSHGRTGLEKLMVGSVSERVIGLAQGAVLVVRG